MICAQLDTHHCKAAMANLSPYTNENKVGILLIQEPYCYSGEPCYIPSAFVAFYVSCPTDPRASLLIRREIAYNFMLLHNFSNPDNILVVTSTSPPIYIASSYLPPYDTPEQDLTPIKNVLTSVKSLNLIWGLDANSKHSMWYSPTTDTRGRLLVDFLKSHGLLTANEKDGPAYSGPTGVSWIDITVTTINFAHKIQNWRVSEDCTQSDHNLILFNLMSHSTNRNSKRTASDSTRKYATQVGNWNMFHQKIQQTGKQWIDFVNNTKTKEQLDKSITEIWYKLKEISKRCFPHFYQKLNTSHGGHQN